MPFKRKIIGITMSLASLLLIAAVVSAQSQQAQAVTPSPEAVKLNVTVLDKEKHVVADIRQDEIQILEDGKPQTISSLEKDVRPLRYALVVDNSGSLRSQFNDVLKVVASIINGNDGKDETLLVRFVNRETIQVVQNFTHSKSVLLDGLKSFGVEPGQSAVIDAVYLSANKIAETQIDNSYRQALILISDGEERASYYTQDALIKLLRVSNIQVYAIGLVNELDKDNGGLIRKDSRLMAEELLTKLAEETGGRAFFPKSNQDLPAIIKELVESLRNQFTISYTPAIKQKKKSYRKIKVSVVDAPGRQKRIAVARTGYTSP